MRIRVVLSDATERVSRMFGGDVRDSDWLVALLRESDGVLLAEWVPDDYPGGTPRPWPDFSDPLFS